MFDPQDDLYKLIARFNQFAVQEIASQVSQISLLLERHHAETSSALEGISRQVGLLRQEAQENSHNFRRTSDLLEKMAAGNSHSNLTHGRDTYSNTIIPPRN
jgi:methyl-accepting chemotaxis protein